MDRITQKNLECLVKRINQATNSPAETFTKEGNPPFLWNIGNYHLDYAYSGVKLVQTANEHGGIRTISTGGYRTKRELYQWMQAFLAGLENN